MPIGTDCAKPHRVCLSRLGATDPSRLSDWTNDLSSQTGLMEGRFETTTQNTVNTNDPGVSPISSQQNKRSAHTLPWGGSVGTDHSLLLLVSLGGHGGTVPTFLSLPLTAYFSRLASSVLPLPSCFFRLASPVLYLAFLGGHGGTAPTFLSLPPTACLSCPASPASYLRASTGHRPYTYCSPFVPFVPLNWLSPVVPHSWLNLPLASPVLPLPSYLSPYLSP